MGPNDPSLDMALGADGAVLDLPGGRTLVSERPDVPPCKRACPIQQNVKAYMGLVADGQYEQAFEVILRDNPFPGVLGRVCVRFCEAKCTRHTDHAQEPLDARGVKRFVAEWAAGRGEDYPAPSPLRFTEKIAVIGAGPAGLTCALDLRQLGYPVTIFEALDQPGGMMVTGIPSFRLPRAVVDQDVNRILAQGIELRTGCRVGRDVTLAALRQEYRAVFVAVGAHGGLKLGLDGEDRLEGCLDAVVYLREANLHDRRRRAEHAVVVGGGDTAIDASRMAIRHGCGSVTILYRRSRNEMPAQAEEIEAAEREGVKIHYLAAPVALLAEGEKLRGLRAVRMTLGEPDASGRRRPIPLAGSEFELPCELLLAAIGQRPELEALGSDLPLTRSGTVAVDDELAAATEGIFAGGDAVTGPRTIVEAVAHGRKAAEAIHYRLRGGAGLQGDSSHHGGLRDEAPAASHAPLRLMGGAPDARPRQSTRSVTLASVSGNFEELDRGFSERAATLEAKRCLLCGSCAECVDCVADCRMRPAIVGEVLGGAPRDLASRVVRIPREYVPGWAGRAGEARLGSRVVPIVPLAASVDPARCIACGTCEEICEYRAPRVRPAGPGGPLVASVDAEACKGCGTCLPHCPTGAITQGGFNDAFYAVAIEAARGRTVRFICANEGPPGPRDALDILVPCAGRVGHGMVLDAFARGARAVLLSGCEDNCRYGFGSREAKLTLEECSRWLALLGEDGSRVAFEREGGAAAAASAHPPLIGGGPVDGGETPCGSAALALLRYEALAACQPVRPPIPLPASRGGAASCAGAPLLFSWPSAPLDLLFARRLGLEPGALLRATHELLHGCGTSVQVAPEPVVTGEVALAFGEKTAAVAIAKRNRALVAAARSKIVLTVDGRTPLGTDGAATYAGAFVGGHSLRYEPDGIPTAFDQRGTSGRGLGCLVDALLQSDRVALPAWEPPVQFFFELRAETRTALMARLRQARAAGARRLLVAEPQLELIYRLINGASAWREVEIEVENVLVHAARRLVRGAKV
ncbi:MAG: FAD-dependent oxidoreductase [Planctomycetota bacterium]